MGFLIHPILQTARTQETIVQPEVILITTETRITTVGHPFRPGGLVHPMPQTVPTQETIVQPEVILITTETRITTVGYPFRPECRCLF